MVHFTLQLTITTARTCVPGGAYLLARLCSEGEVGCWLDALLLPTVCKLLWAPSSLAISAVSLSSLIPLPPQMPSLDCSESPFRFGHPSAWGLPRSSRRNRWSAAWHSLCRRDPKPGLAAWGSPWGAVQQLPKKKKKDFQHFYSLNQILCISWACLLNKS